MFLCDNKLTNFNKLCKKNKYCKERIEAKVGLYMCLSKIRLITIDYCRLMVNNR